jgi:uncharacterized phage protein (TIGR02218 family)
VRSDALIAARAAPVSTLVLAWLVTRRDGRLFGFTQHDRALRVAGVLCPASSSLSASQVSSTAALSVDSMEVAGVFDSAQLTEAELDAGLWDGATVLLYEVDWTTGAAQVLKRGTLGQVRRAGAGFAAEFKSLGDALNRTVVRPYAANCRHVLGDARCGVALGPLTESRTVASASSRSALVVAGVTAAVGTYSGGLLAFISGANAGQAVEILAHGAAGALTLMVPLPFEVAPGDAVVLTPGCQKTLAACTAFGNVINFGGTPYVPGPDRILKVAGA